MPASPELVSMDEVPDEAWIATAAAIGAPASTTEWEMRGVDYVKAVQLVQKELGEPIYGLIIGQNGKSSTHECLAAVGHSGHQGDRCGGRHPRASDRRHGLDRARQFAGADDPVGRRRKPQPRIPTWSWSIRGATGKISPVLRTASDMSGGFIASCRNPVRASYVKKHAALGGISMALALGEAILNAEPKGGKAGDRRHLQGDQGRDHRQRQR